MEHLYCGSYIHMYMVEYATCTFEIRPLTSEIYVNGQFAGRGRVIVKSASERSVEYVVQRRGFQSISGTINFKFGNPLSVSTTLMKIPCTQICTPGETRCVFSTKQVCSESGCGWKVLERNCMDCY
jgi:hypothetical protein